MVINIQRAGLFSEIRKVIQKVLRVLKGEIWKSLKVVEGGGEASAKKPFL